MSTSSPRLPVGGAERKSNPAARLDLDVKRLARATFTTYSAAGIKLLARLLGVTISTLYKHCQMSKDVSLPSEPPATELRCPAEKLGIAVLAARAAGAPEEEAAAVLIELCNQLEYVAIRRPSISGCAFEAASSFFATCGPAITDLGVAVCDRQLDDQERRDLQPKLRGLIEQALELESRLQVEALRSVRDAARNEPLCFGDVIGRPALP